MSKKIKIYLTVKAIPYYYVIMVIILVKIQKYEDFHTNYFMTHNSVHISGCL